MGDDREAGLIWLQEDQAPVLMRVTVMLTPLPADDPRLPGSVTTLLSPAWTKAEFVTLLEAAIDGLAGGELERATPERWAASFTIVTPARR